MWRYFIVLFLLLKFIVVVDNYYNLFGLCGLFNCLDDVVVVVGVFCDGVVLMIDNYCFVEYLRIVENMGEIFWFL